MQDFVNIAAAYLTLYEDGEVPEDLLNLLEKTLENQAQSMTASDAINLVQVFSSSGSSYTLELLDRVIGNNIDQVPAQQAYDAFMAFSFAKKADVRPKIGALLMRCISENLFEYTNDQLLRLCEVLLGGPQASTETQDAGSNMIRGLNIDEFLLNYGGSHGHEQTLQAVEIFSRSSLIELQEYFEGLLIKSARYLDFSQASTALYLMVSREFGSEPAISALLKRVIDDSKRTDLIEAPVLAQSLISLNLAGVEASSKAFKAYAKALSSQEMLGSLSSEEITVLDTLCQKVLQNSA